jgi:cell fate regulator YaaT (PSP1 superfamily)
MSQILGVKFSDYGPVCYFASGALVVRVGQCVLVETDQGLALGRVATVSASAAAPAEVVTVVAAEVVAEQAAVAADSGPAPFAESMSLPGWEEPSDGAEPDVDQAEDGPLDLAGDAGWGAEPAGDVADMAMGEGMDDAGRGEQVHPGAAASLFSSDQATQVQPRPETTDGLQRVYRLATESDLESHAENRRLARRAFQFCREAISGLNLDMKLVDVELLHDRSKMIFFFTAPNRIDFRELIKSLVREFHTRIELRQIGVRHETQMIGAIGNCGQVCCCRRFLRKFAPVTIKMAKEQNLFLNPAKISGICGRLLCCLSYEQKGYEEFHKQCPKIGKRVQTPLGSAKVLRANFFKKSISVWLEDIGEREYTLEEWKEFLSREPGEAASAEAAAQQAQRPARPGGGQPQGRGGNRPSTGRPSRPERSDKSDRPEKTDKSERSARSAHAERGERSEKPDRPQRPERAERAERAERPERPAVPQDVAPDAEAVPTEGVAEGQAHKPRRRRRKSRGPRPSGQS